MNRTIKILITSDIFILTGFGLISPIIAIFIKDDIAGGTIFTASLASAIYLISKSIVQLPFSRYVDKTKNKKKLLLVGTIIVIMVPFLYMLINNIRHMYIIQLLYGIGSGIAYPARLGIRSTSLDKTHESFEWSLYSTVTGIGTAIAAGIGGALAEYLGFNYLFITVGILSMIGASILFYLQDKKIFTGKK